jgi:hypothetical protein
MRWNFFDRGMTCLLFSAATIGVAGGVNFTDPPEDDEIEMVIEEELNEEPAESGEDVDADPEEMIAEIDEDGEGQEQLGRLIDEAQNASEEEKESKREELKNALSEIFRKRTEAQRNRIALMKGKLEGIETQLERRSNLEEQIVQRRMSELLGDKDELSWDHEPEMDLSKRKRAMHERRVLDFPSGFPSEHPFEIVLDRARNGRTPAAIADSRKRVDVEREYKTKGDIYRAIADQARVVLAREQEINRATSAEREASLQNLERLKGVGNQPRADREQQAELLRMQLENMRVQSKLLEKQLQEISKAKSK